MPQPGITVVNAHINDRGCQGPGNMATCLPSKKENGGPGSIAEQTVDHHVNVLLGGGRARFTQLATGGPHVGKSVIESAQLQGYQYVNTAAALELAQGSVVGVTNQTDLFQTIARALGLE